jgi:two-component sensor histidine kinase/PAS domain-containing protein
MYTITHIDLDKNTKKSINIKDLKDYHHCSDKKANVTPLEHTPVADNIDFSVGILIPYNDGEDFIYQYINTPIFTFGDETDDIVGRYHSDLFKNINGLGLSDCLQRAWNENRRIDTIDEVYKDNILMFAYNVYYVREYDFLYIYSKDITDYSRLKYEDERLFYGSQEGLLTVSNKREILRTNNKLFDMIGYSLDEFINLGSFKWVENNFEIITKDSVDTENLLELLDVVISHQVSSLNFEVKFPQKNGSWGYLRVFAIPTRYNGRDVAQISVMNITKTKEREIQALRVQRNLNTIQHMAGVAISLYTNNHINWTSEIFKILDLNPEEIDSEDVNTYLDLIVKEDKHIFVEKFNSLSKENPNTSFNLRIKTPKGNIKHISQLYKSFYDKDGNCNAIVIFTQDITEQKNYEIELCNTLKEKEEYSQKLQTNKEELEYLLKEKELLLREVHDRVKNNLQIIQSLLDLEIHFNPDNPKATIRKTYNRIQSMASAHEHLYSEFDSDTEINAPTYILDSVKSIFKNYKSNIEIKFELDDIIMDVEKIIPLGLILNELAINTIQHAFPNGEEGFFSVVLKENNDKITLIVSDNGVGAPDDFSPISDKNLGITIINNLVDQLDGVIEYLSDKNGFSVLISFNN